ncbi:radical SAM protein [Methanospirillum stamsii]|uniref:Radical SAM protein n=1 Tax=Methanospirillum stamsii TaxID=1277351 RepID=A0A2V2MXZ6_9EURY|nr:radical SAM protein [Methanospirillum stamsii]PWR71155.1 radical SAM protein [Methanospirillum stamsii]
MTKCLYCPHHCDISEGSTGRCAMYSSSNNEIVERYPDHWLVVTSVSVETIPFVHGWPKAKALQISTVGCNLSCPGCVSEILARTPEAIGTGLRKIDAETLIRQAKEEECLGIVFCLNEPTVSLPSFLRVAKLAKEKGLFVACSSNGYFSDYTLNLLLPVLDMVNIGLKGINPGNLRECGIVNNRIVMENIKKLVAAGVHVEVALMHATGFDNDLIQQAKEVVSISDRIPIQIMRCMAFGDLGQEYEPSIPESEHLCARIHEFTPHVYLLNSPGTSCLDTTCPDCGRVLAKREMYGPMGCRPVSFSHTNMCSCGYHLPIAGIVSSERFEEEGMDGGYRPTRALEFIQGIVSCLGVDDPSCAPRLWRSFLAEGGISSIHDRIQKISSYYGIIDEVAGIVDRKETGEELTAVLKEMTARVTTAVSGAARPRVLYTMGYPVFSLNGGRFENHLVETAGGNPVNRMIPRTGKPGVNITSEEFYAVNPDWICISGLFSLPKDACLAYCLKNDLIVPAIEKKNILEMPASWDFGSPRWILGLMLLAKSFHPDRCSWDVTSEADRFYRRFYGVPFEKIHPTRSFIKASAR